jgi:hypothetical protein
MSETFDRIAVGARLYRVGGALAAVVVVKATFALADKAVATLTAPRAIANTDRFHKDDPRRSLALASDLAPRLAAAEVTFVGSAHASTPVPTRAVRLLVSRGQQSLVDKTLHVHGDRTIAANGVGTGPAPFTSMSLVYERAYGGPTFHDNPCGTGAARSLSGETRLPNIVYPSAVQQALAAGFGPIGAATASRRRLLPPGAEAGFRGPVLDLDEPLPAGYFNAAPADQRSMANGAAWISDERITLTGLIAGAEIFDTRLPGARARATARFANQTEKAIDLVPDTIQIDGDAKVACVLFRGSLPLADAAVLAGLRVVGRLTLADGAEHERAAPSLPTNVPAPRRAAHAQHTVALGAIGAATAAEIMAGGKVTMPLGHEVPPSAPPLPFPDSNRAPKSGAPSAPIPGAPWAPASDAAPFTPAAGAQRTLFRDDDGLGDRATEVGAEATVGASPSTPIEAIVPVPPTAPIEAKPAPEPPSPKPEGPLWREPLPEEIAKPSPAAPQRSAPARKDVNALLYGSAPKKR